MSAIDSYTKLLLTMESFGLKDSSPSAHIITKNGDVARTHSSYKFGAYSAYFDGTGDYLSTPTHDDWDLSGGGTAQDFTIEFWFKTGNLAAQCFVGTWDSSQGWMIMGSTTNNRFLLYYGSDSYNCNLPATYNNNSWHHFAWVRESTVDHGYLDGVAATLVGAGGNNAEGNTSLLVGNRPDLSVPYTGFVDEVRVSKGIARYSTTFTPPTMGFSEDTFRYNLYLDTTIHQISRRYSILDTSLRKIFIKYIELDATIHKSTRKYIELDAAIEAFLRKEIILDIEIRHKFIKTFFELDTTIAAKDRQDIILETLVSLQYFVSFSLDIELTTLSYVYGYIRDFRGEIMKKECVLIICSKDGNSVYGMTTSNPINGSYNIGVNVKSGSEVLLVGFNQETFRGQSNMAGTLIATTE